nr:hypothetical protein [Tanacetum cinerariifolium]
MTSREKVRDQSELSSRRQEPWSYMKDQEIYGTGPEVFKAIGVVKGYDMLLAVGEELLNPNMSNNLASNSSMVLFVIRALGVLVHGSKKRTMAPQKPRKDARRDLYATQ